jgi:hypothetical protein
VSAFDELWDNCEYHFAHENDMFLDVVMVSIRVRKWIGNKMLKMLKVSTVRGSNKRKVVRAAASHIFSPKLNDTVYLQMYRMFCG